MVDSDQGGAFETDHWFAMAVRDGGVASIPEPATCALTLAGLAALAVVARRRR